MNIYALTFRDIQYLLSLAEHKHFGKAAKSCFVSQPALSSQIKKIEGYFNTILFERQNNGVFLTPDGLKVIESAKQILHEAKKMEEIFIVEKNVLTTNLNIGIIHTLSPYYSKLFMHKLNTKYPKLWISFFDGYTTELLEELKSGKLDVLIASSVFSDNKIIEFKLFQEPLYLAVNHKHELAKKTTISMNDLDAEDMLFLKDGNCLKDEAIDLCPKNKRGNIKDYQINSIETLKQMIAVNNICGVLPALGSNISEESKKYILIKKFSMQNKAYRQISMFIRKDSPRTNEYIEFLKLLESIKLEF